MPPPITHPCTNFEGKVTHPCTTVYEVRPIHVPRCTIFDHPYMYLLEKFTHEGTRIKLKLQPIAVLQRNSDPCMYLQEFTVIKNGPSMYLNDKKWPIDVPIKTGTPIHVPHFRKKKGPIDVPGSLILRPMFAAHPYNHFCTEYPPPPGMGAGLFSNNHRTVRQVGLSHISCCKLQIKSGNPVKSAATLCTTIAHLDAGNFVR